MVYNITCIQIVTNIIVPVVVKFIKTTTGTTYNNFYYFVVIKVKLKE